MTNQTPIERAALAIEEAESQGRVVPTYELAQIAYETIDTDQLTAIILRTELPGGIKVGHANTIATAVKNWLTGKDLQQ